MVHLSRRLTVCSKENASAVESSTLATTPSIVGHGRKLRIAIFLAGVLFVILSSAAQLKSQNPPPPAPLPTPASKGSEASPSPKKTDGDVPPTVGTIRGRVVSNDGRPVMNANLAVQGVSGTATVKMKPVSPDGTFVFEDLPAGLYIILATAPGYIDESWSGTSVSDLPRHLIGDRLKITMIRGGVITGTVTDAKGQPVVGVPIQASPSTGGSSLGSFMGGLNAETDDRGVYRLFGLLPGQYVVTAGGSGAMAQFNSTGYELDALTYYPSSTRDTAVPVTVRSGDEATGIDIKYRGTRGHSISGTVLGKVEEGPGGGAVVITLSNAGASNIHGMALASTVEQRRTFIFNGVADGDYDLFAGFQTGPTENPMVASKRVTVRNGDLTGVELKLAQLGSIAGTLALDTLKEENRCDKRSSQLAEVELKAPRDDGGKTDGPLMASLFGGVGSSLNAKGEFLIKSIDPGKYRFAIRLPSVAWYVKAINSPAPPTAPSLRPGAPATAPVSFSELSQGVVTVKSSERVSGITIAIGQDAAGLSGKVESDAAIPEGLHVHLLPAEREQANNVLRYRESIVNNDGSFAFTNLGPGRYFVATGIKAAVADGRPRDVAWDAPARARLRTGAEKANLVVELKPCERLADYTLKFTPVP